MTDQTTPPTPLADAAALGYEVVTDHTSLELDPAAARLLPSDSTAVGYQRAADVLKVLVDHVPSPAEFAELEKASGMLVALAVTTPAVLEAVRSSLRVPDDGTAPSSIASTLGQAVQAGASDVHLSVGLPPRWRLGGELSAVPGWGPLSAADMEAAARWILGERSEDFDNSGDFDAAISYAGARWRVSLYRQRGGLALALRQIPSVVPRLEALGLPGAVVNLAGISQGLVLFCGPTGSGKTTSIAALIDRVNRTRSCHILTIEDPVEYVHSSKKATVHQREVGVDTADFASGLRHALRQDPDVILVGEMRDLETMRTALAAAETGHLVFATVHASSASEAFHRIIDAFPGVEQSQVRAMLASSLRAVVAQLLLPTTRPPARQLVCEVLLMNTAVRNMVREERLHEISSVLDSSIGEGMSSMDRSLAFYVASGTITAGLAAEYVANQGNFEQHLRRMPTQVDGPRTGQVDDFDLTPLGQKRR